MPRHPRDPAGATTRQVKARLTEAEYIRAEQLAARWSCDLATALRRALEEAATRRD